MGGRLGQTTRKQNDLIAVAEFTVYIVISATSSLKIQKVISG